MTGDTNLLYAIYLSIDLFNLNLLNDLPLSVYLYFCVSIYAPATSLKHRPISRIGTRGGISRAQSDSNIRPKGGGIQSATGGIGSGGINHKHGTIEGHSSHHSSSSSSSSSISQHQTTNPSTARSESDLEFEFCSRKLRILRHRRETLEAGFASMGKTESSLTVPSPSSSPPSSVKNHPNSTSSSSRLGSIHQSCLGVARLVTDINGTTVGGDGSLRSRARNRGTSSRGSVHGLLALGKVDHRSTTRSPDEHHVLHHHQRGLRSGGGGGVRFDGQGYPMRAGGVSGSQRKGKGKLPTASGGVRKKRESMSGSSSVTTSSIGNRTNNNGVKRGGTVGVSDIVDRGKGGTGHREGGRNIKAERRIQDARKFSFKSSSPYNNRAMFRRR